MPHWRRPLVALALLWAALLLIFFSDAAKIVELWWTSSTFEHCLLIPPIIAWLVWQRASEVKRLEPVGWAPGLLIVAAGALGWLLGHAAGVSVARHYGLVLMLQGAVVACLGPAVARGLLFPLCYLFFLVPAGEGLVPPLQTITAQMCMALLHLFGVPAHIEGVFITIPNGYFEVAEACSGVKFLIAMLAYGVLVCNVCFKSWTRRALFMAAAAVVPILANGLRAWGTIYVAHLTSADFAVGFDHVVYGWIFFAIVIAIMMGLGWPFFDRGVTEPWIDPPAIQAWADRLPGRTRLLPVTIGAVAIALLPVGWSAAIAASGRTPIPALTGLPQLPGWRQTHETGYFWRPRYDGADLRLIQRYTNGAGQSVDLAVAVYGSQSEGHELVGYGHGAVDPDSQWAWTDNTASPPEGRAFRISAPGPVVREVATFYRIGGITTGSETRVKLETLKLRLLGGQQRAMAILVSAEQPAQGRSARPAIDAFLAALGPVDTFADRLVPPR
ncbi:exosortase A [Flavisphingomonas formosensis]|uniref:exosortase A n=1 Tax=Flavisphingomonas formosensis TaxID=861534 RepID=UPI0012FB020A|nr:exosortase A [Sphingomonas formosensis]